MKIVREKIFEVNSSSSHSVAVTPDTKPVYDTIDVINNSIILTGGNYGWEWRRYNDALTKANYAVTHFKNNDSILEKIIDIIKKQTLCENVIIDINRENIYIDHQSQGTLDSDNLHDFIFNKNHWLFLGNDNGSPPEEFEDLEIYDGDKVIPVVYKYKCIIDKYSFRSKYEISKQRIYDFIEHHDFAIINDVLSTDFYSRKNVTYQFIDYIQDDNTDEIIFLNTKLVEQEYGSYYKEIGREKVYKDKAQLSLYTRKIKFEIIKL